MTPRPTSRKPLGAVLLHGFPNGPDYLYPLEARLRALGLPCRAPLLRGHGQDSPDALREVRWTDWLADAEAALDDLLEEAEKAVVIGYSMGGALSFMLAARHGAGLDCVVALAPGVQLGNPLAPGKPLNFLVPLVARFLKTWDFSPRAWQTYRGGYTWVPKEAVLQVLELSRRAQASLPAVNVPVLLVQGRLDTDIAAENLDLIRARIATPASQQRTAWFEKSSHDILYNEEQEAVMTLITDFVQGRMARGGQMG